MAGNLAIGIAAGTASGRRAGYDDALEDLHAWLLERGYECDPPVEEVTVHRPGPAFYAACAVAVALAFIAGRWSA